MTTTDTTPATLTAAELRVTREYLGLTTRWLADWLDVAERSIHRWESGERPVPAVVGDLVEHLEEVTAQVVGAAVDALQDTADVGMLTYRTDGDYAAHHPDAVAQRPDIPGGQMVVPQHQPASWHRAVVARVAHEVPGLEIAYWDRSAG